MIEPVSNLAPTTLPEPCASAPEKPTLQELPGRLTDLGGLAIRRLLPRSQRRLVGPWCFLDAYGPFTFASGKPMDVAPHPHIGLQTVSWLVEGEVDMDANYALEDYEVARGFVLACQSYPVTDRVVVDFDQTGAG